MGLIARVLRSQNRLQSVNQHKRGGEYVFSKRFLDVADGDDAADIVIENPSDSDVDVLVSTVISAGGATYLDITDDASIDTEGTLLTYHEKGIQNGTPTVRVEDGGVYSTTGDTLETFIPGSQRVGGPATTTSVTETTDTRLLEPGDGIRATLTNAAGSTIDCSVVVDVIET